MKMKNSEYILFPKPSNIFEETMVNGSEIIMTVPRIAIHNISVCIPVMEKRLNAYSRKIMNAIITTIVVMTHILSVYLYISYNSSNSCAPNKCPVTLINALPKPLTGEFNKVLSLFDAE